MYADKAKYCLNNFVKEDQLLFEAVKGEYSDKGMFTVEKPDDLDIPIIGNLYQGAMQIGGMELKLVEDLRVQAYVNMIGNKLIPQHLKDVPFDVAEKIHFRFFVIENPIFNAFAFPDGSIFVHSGLMKVIENEAQLAAILGHEIAHVTHEHGRERYKTRKKLELGKGVAKMAFKGMLQLGVIDQDDYLSLLWDTRQFTNNLGVSPTQATSIIESLSLNVGNVSNVFFRKHENQSDRVGLYYMSHAGYDPREAAKVWQKLMNLTGDQTTMQKIGSEFEALLLNDNALSGSNPFQSLTGQALGAVVDKMLDGVYSSHPKAKKRFRNLNQLVAIYYHESNFEQTKVGAEKFKLIVDRLN